jgi:hypothetical protein
MAATKSSHDAKQQFEDSARDAVEDTRQAGHDLADYLREYARENPGTVALWCLGVGFVLGWKMKPW